MEFYKIGLNHHHTPVDIRERFALRAERTFPILKGLKRSSTIQEALYLTTCNRAELYAVAGQNFCGPHDLKEALCRAAAVDPALMESFWQLKTGEEAVRHLFRVTCSLDAMVVGEAQILGQIKKAYSQARESGTTGPFINRTILRALKVAKKVRTDTDIGKGAVSVASVAVDLVKRCLKNLNNINALVVGAGEMGALVAQQLKKQGGCQILVANRSLEKARLIALHCGGQAINWTDLYRGIAQADVVISSTGAPAPVIGKDTIAKAIEHRRRLASDHRTLVMIDLGTPRDIAKQAAKLKEVSVFNIDHLKQLAAQNNRCRQKEALKAEDLVAHETRQYLNQMANPQCTATISLLHQKAEVMRLQELQKTLSLLPKLTADEKNIIETGTKAIISKILDDPIKSMKDSKTSDLEKELLSDLIWQLFHLDRT